MTLLDHIVQDCLTVHVKNKFEAKVLAKLLNVREPSWHQYDCTTLLFNDYTSNKTWRDSALGTDPLYLVNKNYGYKIVFLADLIKYL